jgi:hypothetical protein
MENLIRVSLGEQPILNLGKLHRSRTFLVVIIDVIDPSAHGVAPHEPRIAELQQVGRHSYVIHPRIKPQVVVVWIKNDGHAVVDG